MTKILDTVQMSSPVQRPGKPQPEEEGPAVPSVREAIKAINAFMKDALEDVRKVSVTKLVQLDAEKGTWEAEAEVYIPNATIKALRLPVVKEVLECQPYLLRLDRQLNIIAYGLKDSVEKREE